MNRKVGVSASLSASELLEQFEPVIKYSVGEEFFPMNVGDYISHASMWTHDTKGKDVQVIAERELTLDKLTAEYRNQFGTIQYLRWVPPLKLEHVQQAISDEARRQLQTRSEESRRRLTRGGIISRVIDSLFSVTLLLRGRVPTVTARAASRKYQNLMQDKSEYYYYGRVVKEGDWIVLQYWYFYAYNNWRSGFEGVNDHESDWEMVCVYLYEDKKKLWPEWVAYASHDFHGSDLRRHWNDEAELTLMDKTHPVVYAGAGSHASYFRRGEYQAELSLPVPDGVRDPLISIGNTIRNVLGNSLDSLEHALRIPFVDYATGDGLVIGGSGAFKWSREVIDEKTTWVRKYRGLWGLYAKDPISGENAPAGPLYNRDGSSRSSWYDVLGFAGMDDVSTPVKEAQMLRAELKRLQQLQSKVRIKIEAMSVDLQRMGTILAGMKNKPHLEHEYKELVRKKQVEIEVLQGLKREYAEHMLLIESAESRLQEIKAGAEIGLQDHIVHKAIPVAPAKVKFQRLTELWATISVSGMLLLLAVVGAFRPDLLFVTFVSGLIVLVVFESILRGVFVATLTAVSVILALVSSFILLIEFWRWVLIGLAVAMAVYLLVQRIKR